MNKTYKSSSSLKELSRRNLEGKFGIAIVMFVIIQIASFLASSLLAVFIPSNTATGFLLSTAASFIVTAILGVFQIGFSLFFLKIGCGSDYDIKDLFFGYRERLDTALLISMAVAAVPFLFQTILDFPLQMVLRMENVNAVYWAIPIVLIGLPIVFYISLLFSQAYFIFLDFPSYTAREVLLASVKIMKGHKKRLLYIELSFLPLIFLSMMTCGIGLFWVIPYLNMTQANFYLNLVNPGEQ